MKQIVISMLLMATPITLLAQLKVNNSGQVLIGTSQLGNSFVANLESSCTTSTGFNIGVAGITNLTNAGGPSCGVYGRALHGLYGHNYGVVGIIESNEQGASILGMKSSSTYGVNGNYAGYFMGDALVTGTFSANQYLNPSDIRLKENIYPLRTYKESTLDKVINMNVIEYNYKNVIPSLNIPDSVSVEETMKQAGIKSGKKHFGLIAQELQELYPELVEEGQDGFLSINYVELVPILIRSIQELSQKVEELENAPSREVMNSRSATNVDYSKTAKNVLYQNTPNPFKEQTTIRFSLSDDTQNAAICIFDMTGKMLKKLPISLGETSVSINGWELGEGMFLYTLLVNGHEVDTKRMILSK